MLAAYRRWKKRRELIKASWQPQAREIRGLGTVHVTPMSVGFRVALVEALAHKEENGLQDFDLYCWLIQECVEEFLGHTKVGMDISPLLIKELGEAVLDVSGMTSDSQEEAVKKSEVSQS